MSRNALTILAWLTAALVPFASGFAGDAAPAEESAAGSSETKEADEKEKEKKEDEKPKTIEEVLKDSDRIDGLFTLYRDRKTGDLRLLLSRDQLDKTYLYFTYTENGVPAANQFRGAFGVSVAKAFRIGRFFDRIEFVVENTSFYFDRTKAISRAADANISHAVIADEKIEAEDEEKGLCLIKTDGLFLSENFHRVAPLPNPEKKPHEVFGLGKLNSSKSKIRDVRNYPQNTDVVVEYVYENENAYVRGGAEVTDPRFVSMKVQHSLIEAPENDFQPRFDDPRVGFFGVQVTDLSSTGVTPYRDMISRWHLVKKNPEAAISEPVEPIVFWIENTTPVELRPVIEEAALRWNEAFREAGFENALVIRTQPDDAEWEAGDLRYNVIRWASSPSPSFGGYGPSFYDPRTGQILGADIMLEHVVIGNRLHEARVFGTALEDDLAHGDAPHRCSAGLHAHRETLFASAALQALGADDEVKKRLLEEFIYYLVLHEIGHTLGLNHNFKSSTLHPLEALHDGAATDAAGLCASVMDYPATVFALPGEPQGQFYSTRAGAYDKWAITFAYSTALADPAAEAARLEGILARSTEPALAFGNDADDMRRPGIGIDPRAMIGDMSSDPIGFAQRQIELINTVVPRFPERLTKAGHSYQELLNGFFTAGFRHRQAARVASRFIGGVYVDRAMAGQPGAVDPFTPVSLADQQRAMQFLREAVFAPGAFDALNTAADKLLAQRRSFDHYGTNQDPKLHDAALQTQRDILDHLLHSAVLKRLTDTRVYGNEYSAAAMLTDLTDAIFSVDLGGSVNTFRQNLQVHYVQRLLAIVPPAGETTFDSVAQSIALDRVRWIETQLASHPGTDAETRAHRAHILYRIKRGLDES